MEHFDETVVVIRHCINKIEWNINMHDTAALPDHELN